MKMLEHFSLTDRIFEPDFVGDSNAEARDSELGMRVPCVCVHLSDFACACMRACGSACMRACMLALVRARVRVCVCGSVCVLLCVYVCP